MPSADYGKLVSTADAVVLDEAGLPGYEAPAKEQTQGEGNALWSYHGEGRIDGIPVDERDRGLKVDSDEMLHVMFRLDRRPCSLMLYMSPDDEEGRKAYDGLLQRVYDGEVLVVDEIKQYDPAGGRFIVWVRYDELKYVLHPRFNYLREE